MAKAARLDADKHYNPANTMNQPLKMVRKVQVKNQVIALGFGPSVRNILLKFPCYSADVELRSEQNSFELFRQLTIELHKKGPAAELPMAILCQMETLETERFLLLRNLRQHPVLRYIPVIAINSSGTDKKQLALKKGFDDYYDAPVRWPDLYQRISFLSKFKKQLVDLEVKPEVIKPLKLNFWKRLIDVAVAATAILVLSPLLLLIALAIKLESRGPVIYRSKRVGTGYHVFDFYKFRSMYKDADKRLKDLQHLNQYGNGNNSLFLKIGNDPRVTPLGRILRKTSLDELPQLFNILKGDMSLVGNRPLPVYEAEMLTRDEWAERFLAPAGLTGLWQVTKRGKSDMSTEERINLDIEYARRHSIWFDLRLIWKTIPAMLQEENV
ncbi:MAG: hypothetical protein Kow0027_31340 [Saprospiraceae bacterium]